MTVGKALEKRILIITGPPRVGKTTVLAKSVSVLRGKGVRVGGMFSREVREGNARVGFEVVNVSSAKVGWLAHVNQKTGPQVGKYRVNLADLEQIGVQAILDAVQDSDVVAIDEIGPMELFSQQFRKAARAALESSKLVVAVVHQKAQDEVVLEAKGRQDAEVFEVDVENRENLPAIIVDKACCFLGRGRIR